MVAYPQHGVDLEVDNNEICWRREMVMLFPINPDFLILSYSLHLSHMYTQNRYQNIILNDHYSCEIIYLVHFFFH
jgi:hypothetical protein